MGPGHCRRAAVAGARYDVFAHLNLPRLPVNEGKVTAARAIVIGAAILAALIGALLGGLGGMRFPRNVDKAGLEPHPSPHTRCRRSTRASNRSGRGTSMRPEVTFRREGGDR